MVKKQGKRDKENNMFIKRWCVCHRDRARKKATRTKRALLTKRERRGGRDEEEERREQWKRDEKQWRGSGKYIKQEMMEL